MKSCCSTFTALCNFISCRRNNDSRKIANYDPDVDSEMQIAQSPPPRRKKKSHISISSEQSSYPSLSTVPIINDQKSNTTLSDQEKIVDQPIISNKFSIPMNASTPNRLYYHHQHTRSLIGVSSHVYFPAASTIPINVIAPSNYNEGISIKKNRTHHRSLLTESLPDSNSNSNNGNELYTNHAYAKSSTFNQKKIELSNTTTTDDQKSEIGNKTLRKTTPNFFTSSTIPIQSFNNNKSGANNVIIISPPQTHISNTEIPIFSSSVGCPPSPMALNVDPNLPSPVPIRISDVSCSGDEEINL